MRDDWATLWWDRWLPGILSLLTIVGAATLVATLVWSLLTWAAPSAGQPSRTGTITGGQIRASLMRCGSSGGLEKLQLRKAGREVYATCSNGLSGTVEVTK